MILSRSQSQPKKNVIIESSSGWQDPPNEQLIHHNAATEVMSVYQEFSVLHIMYCTLTDLFVLTPSSLSDSQSKQCTDDTYKHTQNQTL